MTGYPDTSLLCALYRRQDNSKAAVQLFETFTEPLHLTSLLLYEFRHSHRFQVYLNEQNAAKGFPKREADASLAHLNSDISSGAAIIVPLDWDVVHPIAERLSAQYAHSTGQRGFDILHVATALHFGCREFYTFDQRQRSLAKAEGLVPLP